MHCGQVTAVGAGDADLGAGGFGKLGQTCLKVVSLRGEGWLLPARFGVASRTFSLSRAEAASVQGRGLRAGRRRGSRFQSCAGRAPGREPASF